MKANFAAARKAGVMVDVLTSPHSPPAPAITQKDPDINNGTPYMNMDRPAERKTAKLS